MDGQGLRSKGSFCLSMLEARWTCLDGVLWTTPSCLQLEASATPSVRDPTELTQTTLSWLCRWQLENKIIRDECILSEVHIIQVCSFKSFCPWRIPWLCLSSSFRWDNSLTTTLPTLRIMGSSVADETEHSQRKCHPHISRFVNCKWPAFVGALMKKNAVQSVCSAMIPSGRWLHSSCSKLYNTCPSNLLSNDTSVTSVII